MARGLFVPLDVNYRDNPKVLEAGPDAELVYLRSLALACQLQDGGYIPCEAVPDLCREFVHGASAIADRLWDVGLWTLVEDDWWFVSPPHRVDPHEFWAFTGHRQPLQPELRAAVLRRDGYVCGICGRAVDPSDVHIDHIYPYSLGGPTVLGNLQVAHSKCNLSKGARV